MTQAAALRYCRTHWGWESRDCTLARNRWHLMGAELIRRIEAELEPACVPEDGQWHPTALPAWSPWVEAVRAGLDWLSGAEKKVLAGAW